MLARRQLGHSWYTILENILIVSLKNKNTKHRITTWYRIKLLSIFLKKKKKKEKLGPQRKLYTDVQSNFMHNKQKRK